MNPHYSRGALVARLGEPLEFHVSILLLAFLSVLAVGTNPFMIGSGVSIDKSGAGDGIRQVLLLTLSGLALPPLIIRRERIIAVLKRNWPMLLAFGWTSLSITWSATPGIAAHRMAGTLLCAMMTALSATLSPITLVRTVLVFTGSIMLANYAGIALLPDGAIDHEGLWEGLHLHKNSAGCFSAIAALVWLVIGIARRNFLLFAGGLAFAFFLWQTKSATSLLFFAALLPLTVALAFLIHQRKDSAIVIPVGLFLIVTLTAYAYAAIVLISDIYLPQALRNFDFTFTGRTEIWEFVWQNILDAPLLGHGYGSFWAVGDETPSFSRAGKFVAQYSDAHNGYLDVLVMTGFVGLGILTFSLASALISVLPLSLDAPTHSVREASLLCSVILLFGLLHNLFESTLLQGMSITWALILAAAWTGVNLSFQSRAATRPAQGALLPL